MISPVEIEQATYVSWPDFEQENYRGWVLRYAEGCTKRSNSVNVLQSAGAGIADSVTHCESFYKARQQPTIFRLLSFIDDPALDQHLASAGYDLIDPSLVMYRALDESSSGSIPKNWGRKDWFKIFESIVGMAPGSWPVHARIIDRVPATSLCAVFDCEEKPVACGLGVVHDTLFGIFDIVTHRQYRRKGHGTALIQGMLAWALQNGGRHAYVQVLADNTPAIQLYENLGYRRLYHYWYRVRKEAHPGLNPVA